MHKIDMLQMKRKTDFMTCVPIDCVIVLLKQSIQLALLMSSTKFLYVVACINLHCAISHLQGSNIKH